MRKGQIKLFESVAVLVVFAFLVVFGVNFYFTIAKTSLQREIARADQLQVFGLAQKVAFLPELDCAILGYQEEACIDVSKLSAFAEVTARDTDLYFPVFGWSNITLQQVYPFDPDPNVPLYTLPPRIVMYDDTPPKYKTASKVQIPILLLNTSSDEYAFGVIEVTHFAE